MNNHQMKAKTRLQDRLRAERRIDQELRVIGESDGYVLTEVQGVTVTIAPRGGYGLPAVRTYTEGLEAAVNARVLWEQQKERDEADPLKAIARTTGHLNPILDIAWKCAGSRNCPCTREDIAERRKRSLGRTT